MVVNPEKVTVVGALLILLYKSFNIIEFFVIKKHSPNGVATNGKFMMDPSSCVINSGKVLDKIDSFERSVDKGKLSCSWKDRDEVRDFIESIKDLTVEVGSLKQEIRTANNGKKI